MDIKRSMKASTRADIDLIFECYDEAIAFQTTVFHKQWLGFDRALIEKEVDEGRQWQVWQQDAVAAIFTITFNDAPLWGEKDLDPALYLHRIVTRSLFRGQNVLSFILDWAASYCRKHNLSAVRLDTWGDNAKLIDYYISNGFEYYKTIDLDGIGGLPKHYQGRLALLEKRL